MKKIFYIIIAAISIFGASSCSDMLDVDSPAMAIDPELNQKTDSVFYALGIAQAMQQLADQYFFIGEMRGDLSATTTNTDNNLRQLANFTATTTNKYDSAYVYYKVINNCNYYLAHRDTTLLTGSNNITHDEYVAIEAARAWAYMQLGRTYEKVPFFTEPLTTISQINDNTFPEYTLSQIVSALAPSLEKYSGTNPVTFGNLSVDVGTPNWNSSSTKYVYTTKLFVPVDIILGELYLERGESGDYMNAAKHYFTYLNQIASNKQPQDYYCFPTSRKNSYVTDPDDWGSNNNFANNWINTYSNFSGAENITYIPMAVSSLRGATSSIPAAFGYDYYSTSTSGSCPTLDYVQIVPSQDYYALCDSAEYYYFDGTTTNNIWNVSHAKLGDGRAYYSHISNGNSHAVFNIDATDSTLIYIGKCKENNVILYRNTTIWLHLAEALNRAGYPDAAFAILRNGISDYLSQLVAEPAENDTTGYIAPYKYLSRRSYDMLTTDVPFLSAENKDNYPEETGFGIHQHGASSKKQADTKLGLTFSTKGSRNAAVSEITNLHYLPSVIIGEKMEEISKRLNVQVGTELNDSINAMEDILCDEYAKEFAFEGTRFYDLVRMARHKNQSATYSGTFGDAWLSYKLRNKAAGITTKNCYLPFK